MARVYQQFMTAVGRERIELDRSVTNAVIMLAPDYGNIGDLAIGYAQERFLERFDQPFHVQSVPIRKTYRVLRSLRRQLKTDDIVFLVGGGNMGDLYPRLQLGREFIAQYLRGHRIISFPQSIIYMDRPERKASAAREARALSKCGGWLTLFARERESLSVMQTTFSGYVGYAPDIVLSLTPDFQSMPRESREGVLLALRHDAERALSPSDHQVIRDVAAIFGATIDRDHGVPDAEVNRNDTHRLPLSTLELYRHSSLVITDRLHGMIFAAITGTPCVALPNTNHKVTGTYTDWIAKQCAYITMLDRVDAKSLEIAAREVTSALAVQSYNEVRFDYSALTRVILAQARLR
ncbi:polysaccharide pyruvyl transferase family protein [Cryobacterium luteum]|nr:polysaccharide pyruvyl transferase family protein [Cryobacterium luteum]